MKGAHVLYSSVVLASVLTCVTALAPTASLAGGSDTDPPSLGGKKPSAKPPVPATTVLGALVSSISRTDDATLTTTSATFVDIPGAFANVTVGPGRSGASTSP